MRILVRDIVECTKIIFGYPRIIFIYYIFLHKSEQSNKYHICEMTNILKIRTHKIINLYEFYYVGGRRDLL